MIVKGNESRPIDGSELIVEFLGDERMLAPGEELTFGRTGDLAIDDNRYLHRLLGRFSWSTGVWWLSNLGSSIPLTVSDTAGPSFSKVAPGTSVPLSFESSLVTFEAGGCNYELVVEVAGGGLDTDPLDSTDVEGWSGEVTTTASSLPLSPEQRLLLVALAEAQLRDPSASLELPTNRQIAHDLGWTITKYNRKLDGLCVKFAGGGVSGLHGSSDSLARDRRSRLVDHAVNAGVVTFNDLGLLTEHIARARAEPTRHRP
ncbi:MAG: hypothetical protein ABI862_12650 [Ilumatobacteraceae bacterium]